MRAWPPIEVTSAPPYARWHWEEEAARADDAKGEDTRTKAWDPTAATGIHGRFRTRGSYMMSSVPW